MTKGRSYAQELTGYLQDSERAIAYLNAALEEGDEALFAIALQNMAKARGKDADWADRLTVFPGAVGKSRLFLLLKELGLGFISIVTGLPRCG